MKEETKISLIIILYAVFIIISLIILVSFIKNATVRPEFTNVINKIDKFINYMISE